MTAIKNFCRQLNKSVTMIRFELMDGNKQVGFITGKGFATMGNTDVFETGDSLGLDLDMLIEATEAGLLDGSTLFLEEMEILPAYRGNGLGIALIKQAIADYFNKMGKITVLLHPCPLAAPTRLMREQGKSALSNYYAKHLPIQRIVGSPFYYLVVDSDTKL